jgi:hypothetical protein
LANGYYDGLEIWDAAGLVWSVGATPFHPLGSVARLLARTVYNPSTTVRLAFGEPRKFTLDELKAPLRDLIERDDDVLTQNVSRERLTKVIDRADTFDGLLGSLKKHRAV